MGALKAPEQDERDRSVTLLRTRSDRWRCLGRAALLWLFLAAALCVANPVQAQQADPETDAASAPISTVASGAGDAEIADRIRGIFNEIDGLGGVEVSVTAGVVRLGGSVTTAVDASRAAALAQRLTGVVTVENRIERNLTVDENIAPALVGLHDDLNRMITALPLIALAIAIGLTIAAAGYLLAGFDRLWQWVTPNSFLAELVATSLRVLFIALGLFVVLDILDATGALGAILGGAGVVGLAIGFALRDTVDNYISSIMLSLRQPFRANDHVVIGVHEGRVIRLTSRATILMTLDGNHLRVPNATVFKADILNYSRNPERRFEFDLGIDADDDAIEGTEVAAAALRALPFVLADPPPTAHIKEVGDSNIVLTVMGWVSQNDADFLKARSAAIYAAKNRLEKSGFALPEPIYRLRIDQPGAKAALAGVDAPGPGAPAAPADSAPEPATAADGTSDAAQADVSRETFIDRLVAEERVSGGGADDLLNEKQPVE
jgi:small conductance mechanosensitive channel